jgi:AcrR family transcriptional regulator
MTGLREIKKAETRRLIGETAAALFRAQGFDAVTVEAIAQAAGVSKKTVFNYFATKEDLVFHRAENRRAALVAAVTDRADGVSVIESFRALCLARTAILPQLRASARSGNGFHDLIATYPALRRRLHEETAIHVSTLAQALAGSEAPDSVAVVIASTLVAAQQTLDKRLRDLAATPADDETVIALHRHEVDRVFNQLRTGLAAYPR